MRTLDLPLVPVIHNVTLNASRDWISEDPDRTTRVLRSLVEAIWFFKHERDAVCEILAASVAPLIGIEDPADIEHLQETWAELLSAKPYPHPLAIWNVYSLDFGRDAAARSVAPIEPWDLSLLRAIDDSGFIDDLYGGSEALYPAPLPARIHSAHSASHE